VTIRARLCLWYGTALAATLGALGILVWVQFAATLRASLDDALQVQVADVRAGIGRAGEQVIDLDPARPGLFTAIFGPGGRLERATRAVPADLSMPPEGPSVVKPPESADSYALYAGSAANGREIVAGASLADVDRSLASLARLLVAIGAGGGLASLAGGWWLAGRALAPVTLLAHEAEAIGVRDLDRRLPEPSRLDELGRLAHTINGMLERVAAAVQREHAFIVAASHDLRTPIASLRTELELAERHAGGREELLEAIRASHSDAVRLSDLASDLLQLAEADPAGRELVRQPVGLPELLDGARRRVQPIAAARGIVVDVQCPAARVEVDRVRLEQAIVNLVSNAIREAPADSPVEVVASVSHHGPAFSSGDLLHVRVLDRGPGVPADLRPLLFVPFASKARGRETGTGLGLAVAAAAVRAHGGAIGYQQRAAGGAAFWFEVPA
jgi:two-component system OmpR family sensor kinase